jgi:hypothetical protein
VRLGEYAGIPTIRLATEGARDINRPMPDGTIVLVHGTGVRLKDYQSAFHVAKQCAVFAGITASFAECAWGDPLGVQFDGKSLPDSPSRKQLEEQEQDFARWRWLFDDPLFELDKLVIRDTSQIKQSYAPPGWKPAWKELWDKIAAYEASPELVLLLERGELKQFWSETWSQIVLLSPIPELAFERSADEPPEASNALARALVAQLHVLATSQGHPGPSRTLRDSLVNRLIVDWKQQVYAPSGFFANLFKRAATRVLRQHRNDFSDSAALPIGDILLYQARGAEVRKFIRDKITNAAPPVTVVAHSLGGIACVDLLVLPDPPSLARLVTFGSQAPLLYEIGALFSLKPPQALPPGFPPWLNLYDRNDFLSYIASRLFPEVEDVEVESGQPFPDSHGAYFNNTEVWGSIRDFMKDELHLRLNRRN